MTQSRLKKSEAKNKSFLTWLKSKIRRRKPEPKGEYTPPPQDSFRIKVFGIDITGIGRWGIVSAFILSLLVIVLLAFQILVPIWLSIYSRPSTSKASLSLNPPPITLPLGLSQARP